MCLPATCCWRLPELLTWRNLSTSPRCGRLRLRHLQIQMEKLSRHPCRLGHIFYSSIIIKIPRNGSDKDHVNAKYLKLLEKKGQTLCPQEHDRFFHTRLLKKNCFFYINPNRISNYILSIMSLAKRVFGLTRVIYFNLKNQGNTNT